MRERWTERDLSSQTNEWTERRSYFLTNGKVNGRSRSIFTYLVQNGGKLHFIAFTVHFEITEKPKILLVLNKIVKLWKKRSLINDKSRLVLYRTMIGFVTNGKTNDSFIYWWTRTERDPFCKMNGWTERRSRFCRWTGTRTRTAKIDERPILWQQEGVVWESLM